MSKCPTLVGTELLSERIVVCLYCYKSNAVISKGYAVLHRLEKYSPLIAKPKLEKELAALGATEFRKLKAFVGKTVPGMLKNLQQRGIVAAQAAQLEVCVNSCLNCFTRLHAISSAPW